MSSSRKRKGTSDRADESRAAADALSTLAAIPARVQVEVTTTTFTSRLAGLSQENLPSFQELAFTDYEAPRGVRYIRQAATEGSPLADSLDLPAHFLSEELFPLDVFDENALLAFFARWGVTCAPYFKSRERFSSNAQLHQSMGVAKKEVERQTGRRGRLEALAKRLVPSDSAMRTEATILAIMVNEGLSLGEYEVGMSSPSTSGFVRTMREPAALSEAIRAELFFDGVPTEGIISWDEAVTSLSLLRECIAYAVAVDMAKGGEPGSALSAMRSELGVEPVLLGSWGLDRTGRPRGIGASDASVAQFLNACLFSSGTVSMNRFGRLDAGGEMPDAEAWMTRCSGAIESVIALNALQVLSLPSPWRRCAGCGKAFKIYKRGPHDTLRAHLGRRERASDFCCPSCQRRSKREDVRRARELAASKIASNPMIYVARSERDQERVRNSRIALMKEVNATIGAHKFVDDGSGTKDREDAVSAVLRMKDIDELVERYTTENGR